jgi:hypothetical protein
MNDSERIAFQFLAGLEIGEVAYEPDGNIPPDFLIDGRIAVEVRRLNQNEEIDGGYRGLEVTSKPLHSLVTRVLDESGPPAGSRSWFVWYTVRRPLPPWNDLELLLRSAVQHFRERIEDPPQQIRLAPGLRLDFLRATDQHDTLLLLGGSSDHDSGGFVIAELLHNLDLCITEKAKKIAPLQHRYPEWWLVFDDRIAYGVLDRQDIAELRALLRAPHQFRRMFLVDPTLPTRAVEI